MIPQLKERVAFLAGLVCIIGVSAAVMALSVRNVTTRVQADLIRHVELTASIVTPRSIAGLAVAPEDIEKDEYRLLHEQFLKLGTRIKGTDIKGVYVMAISDDGIRFMIDSAPDDDPWHSEPGTVYEEPPPEVAQVNRSGGTAFAGPYSDEYGDFYSIFASDADVSGRGVVVGGDVDVATYDALVREGLRLPAVSVLVLLALYCATYLFVSGRLRQRRALAAIEAERHHVEEERAALLMNVGDGVVACNASGKVTFVNKYASELMCAKDEDCIGKDVGAHWSMVDEKGVPLPIEEQPFVGLVRGTTGPLSSQVGYVNLRLNDGRLLPVISSVNTVASPSGAKTHILTFRDFSKEAEIDKMKSDFISIAVHQIKTPLTGLRWTVELLSGQEEGRTKEDKEALDALSGAVTRLNELVNSLLNITRIESGRLTIDPKPTRLAGLIDDVIKDYPARVKEKGQCIVIDIGSDVPEMSVDPLLVREVYKNLFTNAVKYTPNGGTVTVRLERKGEEIVTSVKDDGYGIPASERERVFGKFYRGKNIVGLDEEGTGLGLYFAKQVAEASGGRLWFESEEGKGSTFFLGLPLAGSVAKKGEAHLN